MTSHEQITTMTNAIKRAIAIMGDRFGSTEEEVTGVIHELKASIQPPVVLVKTVAVGSHPV